MLGSCEIAPESRIVGRSGVGIVPAQGGDVAWHRLPSPALLLLPALALAPACDTEKSDEPIGEEMLEDDAADDAQDADDGDNDDADQPDDGQNDGQDDGQDDDGDEPADDGADDDAPPPEPRPDAAEPCDWEQAWEGYECELDEGEEGEDPALGSQQCLLIDGEEFWTPCSAEAPECVPGDGWDMGCVGEICVWNGEGFEWYSWSEPDCATPLVLNFEGGPVEYAPVAAATFDLSTDGTCTNTAWPTSPWLALDRDGDGFIRSGAELFGSATAMSSGGSASNGFAALTELDSNFDGKITAADERFGELVLWSDLDDDRIGAYAELRPLAETTVVAIDLGYEQRPSCDAMGNCGYERAAFEYRQGETTRFGEVVDVHLACQ